MEHQDRKFKGIWIPAEIWLEESLTLQEKVILVEIDSLEDETRGCYASNKYFADFFKLPNQRISKILQNLKIKGYVDLEYVYQGKEIKERQIRIIRPPYPQVSTNDDTYKQNDNRGINNCLGGYQQKVKENNTYINNININNINKYFENEELNELFKEFLELRTKLKAKNTERAINNLLNILKDYSDDVKMQMINDSITNSWKGLFPIKDFKRDTKEPNWFNKENEVKGELTEEDLELLNSLTIE